MMPIPTWTNTQDRWGARVFASGYNLDTYRHNMADDDCQFMLYSVNDVDQSSSVYLGVSAVKHCALNDFGIALFNGQETKKYSVTCQFFKHFNCQRDEVDSKKTSCIAQKRAVCTRVCEAKSWNNCEHSGGPCPPNLATCTSECNLHGWKKDLFCSLKLAGL